MCSFMMSPKALISRTVSPISRTLLPFSLLFRALHCDGLSNLPPALGQSSWICRINLGDASHSLRSEVHTTNTEIKPCLTWSLLLACFMLVRKRFLCILDQVNRLRESNFRVSRHRRGSNT